MYHFEVSGCVVLSIMIFQNVALNNFFRLCYPKDIIEAV